MQQSTISMWQSSNKIYGYQGSSELPWLAILHADCLTLLSEVNTVHERGQLEDLHLEDSWTLLHVSLPLDNFNLNPFIVPNHGYNSFQWVLWILANYWTWGLSWKPTVAIGVRNKGGLGDCSLTLQPHSESRWLAGAVAEQGNFGPGSL